MLSPVLDLVPQKVSWIHPLFRVYVGVIFSGPAMVQVLLGVVAKAVQPHPCCSIVTHLPCAASWWRCCLIDRACWMRNSRPATGAWIFVTDLDVWLKCWKFRGFQVAKEEVSAGYVSAGFATWTYQWISAKPEMNIDTNLMHTQGFGPWWVLSNGKGFDWWLMAQLFSIIGRVQ